jgi:hypothetical protein
LILLTKRCWERVKISLNDTGKIAGIANTSWDGTGKIGVDLKKKNPLMSFLLHLLLQQFFSSLVGVLTEHYLMNLQRIKK